MVPNFALNLSIEGISLLRRIEGGWTVLGEAALDHHPLRQLPGRQLGVHPQVLHADVGNLAFLEEPVAHDIARPPSFGRRE